MHYKTRNYNTVAECAPNTRKAAEAWLKFCEKNDIDLLVYDAGRTVVEQTANVRSGASQTMRSYHLVGQAIDFCPIKNGVAQWTQAAYHTTKMKKAIKEAKRLGFTWGADWDNDGSSADESFIDSPHLQFEYKGYGTDKALAATPAKAASVSKKPNELADLILPNVVLNTKSTDRASIKIVQRALNGLFFKCGTADGYYGADTKDAVARFQSVHANPSDGVYGPDTRKAMTKELRKL